MMETQEKDYFWFYVGGVILAAIIVLGIVKSSEHDKYEMATKAVAADPSQSAYFHKK
jgi:bacteriorhodopsin